MLRFPLPANLEQGFRGFRHQVGGFEAILASRLPVLPAISAVPGLRKG
jgi:hypothetical protein